MSTLCVIGARGGSKGVPNKNYRTLLGKPLIAYTIEQALSCPDIGKLVVSTDSPEIAEVAKKYGAEVPFLRPAELANDTAGKWHVWQHALTACEEHYQKSFDLFVDLDCTAPLRLTSDISAAIRQYCDTPGIDGVFSVCTARKNPYFNLVEYDAEKFLRLSKQPAGRVVRRQDTPEVYEHVASIYVLSPAYLHRGTGLLSGHTQGYEMAPERCLDIDSEFDFEMVEYLMKKRLGKFNAT